MSPVYLIKNPGENLSKGITNKQKENGLFVNELFFNTIQGEGPTIGTPAIFLRLQGCTLNCSWCDTDWGNGQYFSIKDLLFVFECNPLLLKKIEQGHHLVITGGSPLKQQVPLYYFLREFWHRFEIEPIVEVENECVLFPLIQLQQYVHYWNNSPKLLNAGMRKEVVYKPSVIEYMANTEVLMANSCFKFVVAGEEDWDQIYEWFIVPKLVRRDQIILMPLGDTKQELEKNKYFVAKLAIDNGVRYTTREQLMLGVP